jgi:hypothetical protein
MQEIANTNSHPKKSRNTSISKQEQQTALILRQRAFNAVLCGYAVVLIPTLVMLFLQGFHAWGFDLPEKLVYGLAIGVVGEVAVFSSIILKFLFPQDKGKE